MLRLAQKSSVLGQTAKLLAQQERYMSKAVVFSMGGAMLPAMSPVLQKIARQNNMSEADLTSKLFKDGDKGKFFMIFTVFKIKYLLMKLK